MKKVFYIVTVAITAKSFLKGQLRYMADQGYEVTLICSPDPSLSLLEAEEKVRVIALPMQREISLFDDLRSFLALLLIFFREKPDIVNAGTPKAGLLSMLASCVLGVRKRIYTVHGLRYEGCKGFKRSLLRFLELVACSLSTDNICVSESIRKELIKSRLSKKNKASVLFRGSCNGIDRNVIDHVDDVLSNRDLIRSEFGFKKDDFVLGFVGRIVKDKGILELFQAFQRLRQEKRDIKLVLVGEIEIDGELAPETINQLERSEDVLLIGHVEEVYKYYCIFDLFVYPTHREGLGYALLEAGLAKRAIVSTRVTGVVDAVLENTTSMLTEPQNEQSLVDAIQMYIDNPDMRELHGENGRAWVLNKFPQDKVWEALVNIYER
ncbi:MAG: glycosyltransferase family 4 protein [Motiliproteus sp.]|nr:glycosyltransferase family 4 protein [Motiliproteus sp.]MCW9053468.1 glycosyltransferase family 4 protein [Motiliproteus sp.]